MKSGFVSQFLDIRVRNSKTFNLHDMKLNIRGWKHTMCHVSECVRVQGDCVDQLLNSWRCTSLQDFRKLRSWVQHETFMNKYNKYFFKSSAWKGFGLNRTSIWLVSVTQWSIYYLFSIIFRHSGRSCSHTEALKDHKLCFSFWTDVIRLWVRQTVSTWFPHLTEINANTQ